MLRRVGKQARPTFVERLADAWPPAQWQDVTVLLAVSGGADSVALLVGLASLKSAGRGRLLAAHFNHRLRGEEADGDAAFVESLCQRLAVPLEMGMAEPATVAGNGGQGLEARLRQARYGFLRRTSEACGARYLVTAHTADDQAETILHRIVRGTGIAGLAGMPRARPLGPSTTLLRPMLSIRRAEVLDYLASIEQTYRHDGSNDDPRFTRNRIRHRLLPALAAEINPLAAESLLSLGALAGEVQSVVDRHLERLASDAVEAADRGARVDLARLAPEPRYLVRELFIQIWRRQGWPRQDMGFERWDELADLAAAAGAVGRLKKTFPGSIAVERVDGMLYLQRV